MKSPNHVDFLTKSPARAVWQCLHAAERDHDVKPYRTAGRAVSKSPSLVACGA